MTVGRTYSARVPSVALTVSFHVSQARSGHLPFISSTRLAKLAALALRALSARPLRRCLLFQTKSMQQHIFQFGSEPQNTTNPHPSSSLCSSVQEPLVTYCSRTQETVAHLGLFL